MAMERLQDGGGCGGSVFTTGRGAREAFVLAASPRPDRIEAEIAAVHAQYRDRCARLGLDPAAPAFSRLYVSDLANQDEPLQRSALVDDLSGGAVSIVQQCPMTGGSLALLSYHLDDTGIPFRRTWTAGRGEDRSNGLFLACRRYGFFWQVSLAVATPRNADRQTTALLKRLKTNLLTRGMTLHDNAVRTWVYVRDIDQHYGAMVRARREFFEREELRTRYIASTGIEGIVRPVGALVGLDTFAAGPLEPGQLVRMEAPDHLSPTIAYGVTFERGSRLRFGDRSHLYISGTASIDREGNIVHPGDPAAQTHRILDNIEALLAPHGAGMPDMAYILAYLRSWKDYDRVAAVLRDCLPADLPLLVLVGAVCRPGWLVELEGRAIIPDDAPYPAFG